MFGSIHSCGQAWATYRHQRAKRLRPGPSLQGALHSAQLRGAPDSWTQLWEAPGTADSPAFASQAFLS